jgi:hypothetical protein
MRSETYLAPREPAEYLRTSARTRVPSPSSIAEGGDR